MRSCVACFSRSIIALPLLLTSGMGGDDDQMETWWEAKSGMRFNPELHNSYAFYTLGHKGWALDVKSNRTKPNHPQRCHEACPQLCIGRVG